MLIHTGLGIRRADALSITQMEPFPTKIEDLKKAVQDLWDEMDSCDFIQHIERMSEKMQQVLQQKGMQTKY